MRMKIIVALVLTVAACKSGDSTKTQPQPKPVENVQPAPKPVDPTTEDQVMEKAAEDRLKADAECPSGDRHDCKKKKVVTPAPTPPVDPVEEKAAEDRLNADAKCPSGDRHDCDGDGFRAGDDKDDNDPKVH